MLRCEVDTDLWPLFPPHGASLTEASSERLWRLGHEVHRFVLKVCPVLRDLYLFLLDEAVLRRSDWRSLQPRLGLGPAQPLHIFLLHLVDSDESVDVVPGLQHLVVPVNPSPSRAEHPHHLRPRPAGLGGFVQALVPVAQCNGVGGLLHGLGTGSGGRRSGRARPAGGSRGTGREVTGRLGVTLLLLLLRRYKWPTLGIMFTLHARNFFSIRSSFFLTMSISIFFLFSVRVNYSGLTVCCSLTAVWHWDGYKELRQLLRQFPAREVKFSPKEGQKARVLPQSLSTPPGGVRPPSLLPLLPDLTACTVRQ